VKPLFLKFELVISTKMLNIFQKDKTEPSKLFNSNSQSDSQDAQPRIIPTVHKLLYPKPEILLIDMKD